MIYTVLFTVRLIWQIGQNWLHPDFLNPSYKMSLEKLSTPPSPRLLRTSYILKSKIAVYHSYLRPYKQRREERGVTNKTYKQQMPHIMFWWHVSCLQLHFRNSYCYSSTIHNPSKVWPKTWKYDGFLNYRNEKMQMSVWMSISIQLNYDRLRNKE